MAKVTDKTAYDHLFAKSENDYNLPPGLLKAIAWAESGYNQNAVSPQRNAAGELNGGKGLMQFVNSTARRMGVDPFDPMSAIDGAAKHLSGSLKTFDGDISKAIQAYNMGDAGAKRFFNGDTSVMGDKNYATKVQTALQQINGSSLASGAPGKMYNRAQTTAPGQPISVADALDYANAQDGIAVAQPNGTEPAPGQPGWQDDVGTLGMTSKLTAMFDKLNAEHEATARTGRAQLEELLGDVA
jgi:hypothetical protein